MNMLNKMFAWDASMRALAAARNLAPKVGAVLSVRGVMGVIGLCCAAGGLVAASAFAHIKIWHAWHWMQGTLVAWPNPYLEQWMLWAAVPLALAAIPLVLCAPSALRPMVWMGFARWATWPFATAFLIAPALCRPTALIALACVLTLWTVIVSWFMSSSGRLWAPLAITLMGVGATAAGALCGWFFWDHVLPRILYVVFSLTICFAGLVVYSHGNNEDLIDNGPLAK